MKKLLVLVALLFVIVYADPTAPLSTSNFDFSSWNTIIERYVVPGIRNNIRTNLVDYHTISTDDNYQSIMTQFERANTSNLSFEQYYSFWINAFNFAVVRTIIENPCKLDLFPGGCGPITSIRQIGKQQPSPNTVVWKRKCCVIASTELSLNDIMDKLKYPPKPWNVDPRFHSAITTGAISSPDLIYAFGYPSPDVLDSQLNSTMLTWLLNKQKGSSLNIITNTLLLSQTFKWNGGDFAANGRNLIWWIKNYGTPILRAYTPTPVIQYLPFDWTLNGAVGSLCGTPSRPCFPWWGMLVSACSLFLFATLSVACCYCSRAIRKRRFRDSLLKNDINGDR